MSKRWLQKLWKFHGKKCSESTKLNIDNEQKKINEKMSGKPRLGIESTPVKSTAKRMKTFGYEKLKKEKKREIEEWPKRLWHTRSDLAC